MTLDKQPLSYEQIIKWYFEAKDSKEYMSTIKADMSLRILKDRYYDRFVKEYPEELI